MKRNYNEIEWTDERVRRFWDYESQFPQNYFSYQAGASLVEALSGYFAGCGNVLDYGCGIGCLIPHLLEKNLEVTAADFSSESIQAVNSRFSGNPLFKGGYTPGELDRKGETFDLIISADVIEHLDNVHLEEAVKRFGCLLSSKGVVILTTPNNEDLNENHVFCPNCETIFNRWQHVRSWSTETLTHFFVQRGFERVDVLIRDLSPVLIEGSHLILLKRKLKSMIRSKLMRGSPSGPNLGRGLHLVGLFKVKQQPV